MCEVITEDETESAASIGSHFQQSVGVDRDRISTTETQVSTKIRFDVLESRQEERIRQEDMKFGNDRR